VGGGRNKGWPNQNSPSPSRTKSGIRTKINNKREGKRKKKGGKRETFTVLGVKRGGLGWGQFAPVEIKVEKKEVFPKAGGGVTKGKKKINGPVPSKGKSKLWDGTKSARCKHPRT